MYLNSSFTIFCVPKDPRLQLPEQVSQFRRVHFSHKALDDVMARIDLPTDDWPFLYLNGKSIPTDYIVAIFGLLAFSIASVACLRRGSFGRDDFHFGLLGMGFLLLETKSIGDSTLFFGATWFVTMIVVAGVLVMVIGANLVAQKLEGFSIWMYAPLFAVLAILVIVPREHILEYAFAGRLLWTLFVVPLPIFFAGIIFSTTFRHTPSPSAAFGANLIGAMIGGFCEYLSMAIGSHQLSILIIVAYLGSMLVLATSGRVAKAV